MSKRPNSKVITKAKNAIKRAREMLDEGQEQLYHAIRESVGTDYVALLKSTATIKKAIDEHFEAIDISRCRIYMANDKKNRLFTISFLDCPKGCTWTRGGEVGICFYDAPIFVGGFSWPSDDNAKEHVEQHVKLLTWTFVSALHARLAHESLDLVPLEVIKHELGFY